jgi:hypothetical protein
VSPARRLIICALGDLFDPCFTFDPAITARTVRYLGFFGRIILQNRDGGGIEDAQDLATGE